MALVLQLVLELQILVLGQYFFLNSTCTSMKIIFKIFFLSIGNYVYVLVTVIRHVGPMLIVVKGN